MPSYQYLGMNNFESFILDRLGFYYGSFKGTDATGTFTRGPKKK
jgi:hypothetical protein